MEFLELLLGSGEMCGCLLELLAGTVDVLTIGIGQRARRQAKAKKAGMAPGSPKISAILFWLGLPIAIVLTGLVILKWGVIIWKYLFS